ncbi:hypothetical protein B0H19DRAFT_1085067 [Mycena capillaripes]|nr:hypothetical protein B0H19DRAFT_1085067 [Mycena capillaripes]
MDSYEVTRQALIALDAGSAFPSLAEADLYMKPVVQKRRVGDSQHTDGALWRLQAMIPPEVGEIGDEFGENPTVSAPRRKRNSNDSVKKVVDERPEGWVWQLGRLSKMSDAEMDEWSSEEPEMQRWQEQKEQKLAELLRTNRSFLRMEVTWATLALDSAQKSLGHTPGANIDACGTRAAMYRKRAERAQALITAVGYGDLLAPDASIIQRVQQELDEEAKLVADALSVK